MMTAHAYTVSYLRIPILDFDWLMNTQSQNPFVVFGPLIGLDWPLIFERHSLEAAVEF